MLSPPVDNFKEPEPLFQVEKNKGKLSSNNKGITNFHFSHCVMLFVQIRFYINNFHILGIHYRTRCLSCARKSYAGFFYKD